MVETREHALVLVTCGSGEEARRIARHLVENRLAAGVQIVPIDSLYWWEGQVVEDSEWLLVSKTRRDRFDDVAEAVTRLHSYEVPPVLMLNMDRAASAYLDWIDSISG